MRCGWRAAPRFDVHAGLFGGNFHTHNELRLPPGVDAICHSNGADYAATRGRPSCDASTCVLDRLVYPQSTAARVDLCGID